MYKNFLFIIQGEARHYCHSVVSVCAFVKLYHGNPGLHPITITTIVVTNIKQYDINI